MQLDIHTFPWFNVHRCIAVGRPTMIPYFCAVPVSVGFGEENICSQVDTKPSRYAPNDVVFDTCLQIIRTIDICHDKRFYLSILSRGDVEVRYLVDVILRIVEIGIAVHLQ